MKLSQCKHGILVQEHLYLGAPMIGMIVGLSQISNTPAPLVKFSHLDEPLPVLAQSLIIYEE